jgi:hypothetical protein
MINVLLIVDGFTMFTRFGSYPYDDVVEIVTTFAIIVL